MKADLSRDSFEPADRNTAVVQQQGRVITDADWNEQQQIQNHLRESLARDAFGPTGVPRREPGFAIAPATNPGGQPDLLISSGRLYLNGRVARIQKNYFYTAQPDLPGAGLPDEDGFYLAYLEIRERTLTALERPELREIALAGVESSARTQTIAQVKLLALADAGPYGRTSEPPEWTALQNRSRGRLLARTLAAAGSSENLCAVGARGGYTGVDNYLYRIEIHQGGSPGDATFKWSRSNASFAVEWLGLSGNTLTIRSPGRDTMQRFAPGDWLELNDEGLELENRPGSFARVIAADDASIVIDPESLLHFDGAPGPAQPGGRALAIEEFARGIRRARRWDRTPGDADAPVTLIPGGGEAVAIENGIELVFDTDPDREYRSGDYWMIPARSLTRNILWPCDEDGEPRIVAARPVFDRSRLAFLECSGGNWNLLADARTILPEAADGLLYYVSGDGQAIAPGGELAEPLRVRVAAGNIPLPDARLRFSVRSGDGILSDLRDLTAAGSPVLELHTDARGLGAVVWKTGSDPEVSQTVRAELLDDNGESTDVYLDFRAHKSFAASTQYAPPAAPDPLNDATTTQAAIDGLNALKVDRAGDVIDGDLEIKGKLTVRGDVIAKDTEQMPGDVELGDQDEDTVTIHGGIQSAHSSGALVIQDGLEVRTVDPTDAPLRVQAVVQGVQGRSYRRLINIDNTANSAPLNDYQTLIKIDTSDAVATGKMRPDGADLLFRAGDVTLAHWLESGIGTNATRIWLRMPVIPGSSVQGIDLYYGSETAASRSSKAQTFLGEVGGIAAAYEFETGAGNIAFDSAGSGLDGTIEGAVWSPGRAGGGQALLFDGNDRVALSNLAGAGNALWRGNAFSIAAWVRADQLSDDTTGHAVFDNQSGTSAPERYYRHSMALLADGFAFQINRGDTVATPNNFGRLVIATPPQIGEWYLLTMTAEDLGPDFILRAYINGILAGTQSFTGANLSDYPAAGTATSFTLLGNSDDNLVPFFGALDGVRFYNRALSADEITKLYDFRSLTTPANPGRELLRRYAVNEPVASFGGPEETLGSSDETMLFVENGSGNVGIGTDTPDEKLSVAGIIESSEGGIKFPDGTVQTTAGGGSSLIAGGANLPLGTIIAWHKNFDGTVPDLPEGWLECNGQTVDDPASPYFGKQMPDLNNAKNPWNSKGSFLRGGLTSGGPLEDDQFQGHWHNMYDSYGAGPDAYWHQGIGSRVNQFNRAVDEYFRAGWPASDGVHGSPRFGHETRPVNMAVVWIMHIHDAAGGGGAAGLWDAVGGGANFSLGNVGIDESNPQAKLHLGGAAGLDGILFPDGTLQTTAAGGSHLPVGTIIAWHKSLNGTPNLPEGWVECNGQMLVDPQSLYNGETMPDLNNPQNDWNDNGSFLRGGPTSGEFEADQVQQHRHHFKGRSLTSTPPGPPYFGDHGPGYQQQDVNYAGVDVVTEARTGTETRPANMTVVWIIKVRDTAQINAGGYAFLYDRKASGTPGGTATANAWNVRELNVLNTNIPGVALNANRFTLPPGQYTVDGDAIGYRTAVHRLQIWNLTDDVAVLTGISINSNINDSCGIPARISGNLTIARNTEFELRHFVQSSTQPPFDFGSPIDIGLDECYAQLALLKLTAPGIAPASGTEAGAVQAFAMATPPTGWLACNGQEVSRESYPVLFERVGTEYGAGDGATTFNLPDLRGEFIRGWDDGRGVDAGRAMGSSQADALQDHTHEMFMSDPPRAGTGTRNSHSTGPRDSSVFKKTYGIEDGRSASETRPRNVAMLYCIKY